MPSRTEEGKKEKNLTLSDSLLVDGKVSLGTGILDGLLDDLLNLIPVTGIKKVDLAAKVLLDFTQHVPLVAARDE